MDNARKTTNPKPPDMRSRVRHKWEIVLKATFVAIALSRDLKMMNFGQNSRVREDSKTEITTKSKPANYLALRKVHRIYGFRLL